jgi:DNA-binding response OmpR family regulator
MRILVVDDDPSVRDLVALQLEAEGHEVVTAVDGQAAMDALAARAADVMVLDVMMPRLNGWDVLERLQREQAPDRPAVVLLTAKDLPDDRQRARELDAMALLAKPHDGQVLVDVVNAVAAARRPRA